MVFEFFGAALLFALVFIISMLLCIVVTFRRPMRFLKADRNEKTGTVYRELTYKNDFQNTYDLYVPASLDSSRPQAVVLYIHGGGFTGGSKSSGEPWCKFLASKGYLAASMDYTVSNKEHTSDLNRMNSEIDACVTAIYEKCAELGLQVTQMATMGDSAGGCLAMLYAYSQRSDAVIPVRFVCQQTGPAHFEPIAWSKDADDAAQAAFAQMMTGKSVTAEDVHNGRMQRLVDEISPTAFVNKNTVPTLCAYGPNDHVVPVGLKFKLFEAFEKNGVPYDYIEYPHSNHGMYSDLDKQKEYVAKMIEYCETYFDR